MYPMRLASGCVLMRLPPPVCLHLVVPNLHPVNVSSLVPVFGPVISPLSVADPHSTFTVPDGVPPLVTRRTGFSVEVNGFGNTPVNSGNAADADTVTTALIANTAT